MWSGQYGECRRSLRMLSRNQFLQQIYRKKITEKKRVARQVDLLCLAALKSWSKSLGCTRSSKSSGVQREWWISQQQLSLEQEQWKLVELPSLWPGPNRSASRESVPSVLRSSLLSFKSILETKYMEANCLARVWNNQEMDCYQDLNSEVSLLLLLQ